MQPAPIPLPRRDGAPPARPADAASPAREAFAQRLIDAICRPGDSVSAFERQLAGDVVIGLLRGASPELREKAAKRIAAMNDPPKPLLRLLASDHIAIARPILEACPGLDDWDIALLVGSCGPDHWRALAERRGLGPGPCGALIATMDPQAVTAVLRNTSAKISPHSLDLAVSLSREAPTVRAALPGRAELRPAQALTIFWWSGPAERLALLRRFAVERGGLISALADLYTAAAAAVAADAEVRKSLQAMERRRRSRAAAERSPYGSLEGAILAAREAGGMGPEIAAEFAHMAGLRPATMERMLADAGGEPLGVLAKAVGLKQAGLADLWRCLGRPIEAEAGAPFANTLVVFETLSHGKAQTVVRFWNWAMTSDPMAVEEVLELGDQVFTPAQTISRLLRTSG